MTRRIQCFSRLYNAINQYLKYMLYVPKVTPCSRQSTNVQLDSLKICFEGGNYYFLNRMLAVSMKQSVLQLELGHVAIQ